MTYKPLEDKAKMDRYEALLANMDWTYEYSDDNRVYQAGSEAWMEAVRLGEEVDPEWVVWNEHAPLEEQR